MSDKRNIKSSTNDHQAGSLEQAPNSFLDLFGRLTKFLQEPNFDEQRTTSSQSIDEDLKDIDLEGERPSITVEERLQRIDRKTMLFVGYIFWAMLFVSGGAAAVTLIARKPQDDPTIAPGSLQELHTIVVRTLEAHFVDDYGGECVKDDGRMNCAITSGTRRLGYGQGNRGLCRVTHEFFKPISAEYRWDENSNRPSFLSVTTRRAPGSNMCEDNGYNFEVISLDHDCDADCFKDRLDNVFKPTMMSNVASPMTPTIAPTVAPMQVTSQGSSIVPSFSPVSSDSNWYIQRILESFFSKHKGYCYQPSYLGEMECERQLSKSDLYAGPQPRCMPGGTFVVEIPTPIKAAYVWDDSSMEPMIGEVTRVKTDCCGTLPDEEFTERFFVDEDCDQDCFKHRFSLELPS